MVAAICSSMLLGQTIRVSWLCLRGAVIGGILGTCVVAFVLSFGGMKTPGPWVVYLIQGVISMALLYYPMPSLEQKLAWALLTVGTATLLEHSDVNNQM
jgi:hypothetical protein